MSRSTYRLRTILLVLGLILLLLFWLRLRPLPTATAPPATPPATPTAPDLDQILNQAGPHWLPGRDLSHRNLYGAILSKANLRAALLSDTNLAHADLTGANLMLADLHRAQLLAAQLSGADLGLANLTDARLVAANLTAAKLEGADLKGAQLMGARLDQANLTLADLRRASLRFASLRGANLTTVDFSHADLQGADLSGAVLNNADLSAVNLQGVVLTGIISDAHTLWPTPLAQAEPSASAPVAVRVPGDELPIEMNLIPPLIPFFNQTAHPEDTARVDHVSDLGLLAAIRTGQRMAVFKSAALAEALVPRMADQIDVLGYNLEQGPLNPVNEQADPVGAVQRMRTLANRYGLRLALGPDHDFALSHGASLAPLVDQFVLQLQRVQDQPALAHEFVSTMSPTLRHANPNIVITVQVAASGDVVAVAALINSLQPYIDGVALLTDRSALDKVAPLWTRLRPRAAEAQRLAPLTTAPPPLLPALLLLGLGMTLEATVLLGLWGVCHWLNRRLFSAAATHRP